MDTETKIDHSPVYLVRDLVDDDRKFITASFLQGLYYGDSWFSAIPLDIFMSNYKKALDALLANPGTVVKVACLKDEQDTILGYSILGNNYQTIHWVFVKSAWRKGGIGKALTPQFPTVVTHLNALGKSLLNKVSNPTFNPFAF